MLKKKCFKIMRPTVWWSCPQSHWRASYSSQMWPISPSQHGLPEFSTDLQCSCPKGWWSCKTHWQEYCWKRMPLTKLRLGVQSEFSREHQSSCPKAWWSCHWNHWPACCSSRKPLPKLDQHGQWDFSTDYPSSCPRAWHCCHWNHWRANK